MVSVGEHRSREVKGHLHAAALLAFPPPGFSKLPLRVPAGARAYCKV